MSLKYARSSQTSRALELDAAYLQTKAKERKSKLIDKKEWSYKNQTQIYSVPIYNYYKLHIQYVQASYKKAKLSFC